jgi:hypothetical protein
MSVVYVTSTMHQCRTLAEMFTSAHRRAADAGLRRRPRIRGMARPRTVQPESTSGILANNICELVR